jgi:non-heme chloroperoxidase
MINKIDFKAKNLTLNAILKIYAGAPHGIVYTHKDQLNSDLLAFLES